MARSSHRQGVVGGQSGDSWTTPGCDRPRRWGEFATVREVSNDTCTGDHGLLYKLPFGRGFGHFAA